MLDQLIKLVQQNADDSIVKNQAVPNEFNGAAIQDIAAQIMNGLKGQASQGNVQELAGMFNGGGSPTNNPMVSQIISSIAGNLASKFGVSPQAAAGIANSLIPMVLNQFVNKTNDPNDNDFDLQDVLKNVTGKGNVGDILSQFTGDKGRQGASVSDALGSFFK
jgi:hypothetical protein